MLFPIFPTCAGHFSTFGAFRPISPLDAAAAVAIGFPIGIYAGVLGAICGSAIAEAGVEDPNVAFKRLAEGVEAARLQGRWRHGCKN